MPETPNIILKFNNPTDGKPLAIIEKGGTLFCLCDMSYVHGWVCRHIKDYQFRQHIKAGMIAYNCLKWAENVAIDGFNCVMSESCNQLCCLYHGGLQ